MSNLKVQASPTGTGVVTLTAPTTNTDRTVTLPDTTGTLYISGGDIGTPSAGNGSNLTNLNASNLASGTVPTARLATGTANSTTFLRGDQTWAAAGSTADVQTFNSSGTWTKPTAGQTMAQIQLWGGGGGGARTNGSASGAGGGGGYNEVTVPLSYLASSVSVTVGAGGAGATTMANGSNGGTSQITLSTAVNGRSTFQAFGGGYGAYNGVFDGGGGSALSGPTAAVAGTSSGASGTPSLYAGGSASDSGPVVYGGGAGRQASSAGTGGISLYGGAGGAGPGTAGTAPGGGGGSGGSSTNGGNGAAGRVIITCW